MAARYYKNQKPAERDPKKDALSAMIVVGLCAAVLLLSPLFAALPEESTWSALLTALIACAGGWRWIEILRQQGSSDRPALLVAADGLPVLALLSFAVRWLLVDHATEAYVDVMMRGVTFWVALALIFGLCATIKTRSALYLLAIAIFVGATLAASIGVQDYLIHVRDHQSDWREFGTSSPDFYAGYLVISIPIALALFLSSPSGGGKLLWAVFGVGLLLQLAAVPTTGSRFALISLLASILVFAGAVLLTRRWGLKVSKPFLVRLIALLVVGLVGAAAFVRPILNRLTASTLQSQSHSGDFRVWTWKGTIRLIESSPLVGAGPSTFVYSYPVHAFVGFTRHAHNAYLQTASDLGVPALVLVLLLFAGAAVAGVNALRTPQREPAPEPAAVVKAQGSQSPLPGSAGFINQVAGEDDRILLCGFLASLAASLLQNFVDSDWFTFAGGITLFAVAGVLVSFSRRHQRIWTAPRFVAVSAFAACIVVASVGLIMGIAGMEAQTGDYLSASALEPLNADYAHSAATRIYYPANNAAMAQQYLARSAVLAPDSSKYYLLGEFYAHGGETQKAQAAYITALTYDPNAVAVLLALGQSADDAGDHGSAQAYYRRIAALEAGPYGQILSITEVTEIRYAEADAAIGADCITHGDYKGAVGPLLSAKTRLETYADEGGAAAPMRVAMTGGSPDPALDGEMRQLYRDVTRELQSCYEKIGNPAAAQKVWSDSASYLSRFPGK